MYQRICIIHQLITKVYKTVDFCRKTRVTFDKKSIIAPLGAMMLFPRYLVFTVSIKLYILKLFKMIDETVFQFPKTL